METAKTTIFNLIILDESGSMTPLVNQTISGCNETLNVIRSTQQDGCDKIRNLVSIFAFQSNSRVPSRYIVKNTPIDNVKDITKDDYKPLGSTPLYDAVGSTISELQTVAATHQDAMAIITVITDGMENSSKHYSAQQVAAIIDAVKELGWTVNFIGANIDSAAESSKLHIDNSMQWDFSKAGTEDMYCLLGDGVRESIEGIKCEDILMHHPDRVESRKNRSKSFFKKR